MLKVVVISLYYTVKVLIWSELLDLQIQRRNVSQRSRRQLQKNRRRARSRRSTHKTSLRRWMNPSRRRATLLIVSEKQAETRAVDEEVRADESAAETRRRRGLTSVCVSQRSKVLAQKRQSVLRSLQGLVTSTRGKTPSGAEEPQKRPERSRGARSPVKPTEDEQNGERRSAEWVRADNVAHSYMITISKYHDAIFNIFEVILFYLMRFESSKLRALTHVSSLRTQKWLVADFEWDSTLFLIVMN